MSKRNKVKASVAGIAAAVSGSKPDIRALLATAQGELAKAQGDVTAAAELLSEAGRIPEGGKLDKPKLEAASAEYRKAVKHAETVRARCDELSERVGELDYEGKVIQMPAFRSLESLAELEAVGRSSDSDDITEQSERGTQRAILAARELDSRYAKVADVFTAADKAQTGLSAILVELARDIQGRYSNTDNGRDARIKAYDAWIQVGGEELCKRHNLPDSLGDWRSKLRSIPVGRYWLQTASDARQAIKEGLDLRKVIPGTSEYMYRNTRIIRNVIAEIRSKRADERKTAVTEAQTAYDKAYRAGDDDAMEAAEAQLAKLGAKLETPSAATAGQTAGTAEQGALRFEGLPDAIARGMSRLNQAVHGCHYQPGPALTVEQAKERQQLVVAILSAAVKDVADVENGDFLKRTDEHASRIAAAAAIPEPAQGVAAATA
jgi:hypothetical protein